MRSRDRVRHGRGVAPEVMQPGGRIQRCDTLEGVRVCLDEREGLSAALPGLIRITQLPEDQGQQGEAAGHPWAEVEAARGGGGEEVVEGQPLLVVCTGGETVPQQIAHIAKQPQGLDYRGAIVHPLRQGVALPGEVACLLALTLRIQRQGETPEREEERLLLLALRTEPLGPAIGVQNLRRRLPLRGDQHAPQGE